MKPLTALSPLDGRYHNKVETLRKYFSEYALIRHRIRVEIEWLKALSREQAISEVRKQAVDLAILAAGKVIEQTLTAPEHYRLVNEFLEKAEVANN